MIVFIGRIEGDCGDMRDISITISNGKGGHCTWNPGKEKIGAEAGNWVNYGMKRNNEWKRAIHIITNLDYDTDIKPRGVAKDYSIIFREYFVLWDSV